MKKETLDILSDAISDVGSWQWWYSAEDMFQLEFCDVMLYNDSVEEKQPHSSVIAIRFYGNSFAVLLDNLEEEDGKKWYEKLHDDEISPFELEAYCLAFDDAGFAEEVYDSFRNKIPMNNFPGKEAFSSAEHLIAGKCGDYGFIAGGKQLDVVGKMGKYSEEEIEPLVRKWWQYWRDYWQKRKTEEAYEKDWACEVTIPVDSEDPKGNF